MLIFQASRLLLSLFSYSPERSDTIKLIIAEKPSVAQTIAKVLGAATREDGCFSNSEYCVSWCIGHLVSAAYPPAYDPQYKSWNLEDLPILPVPWKYEMPGDKKKQFNILKKLMNSADVDELICVTDSGREGELIFRLVYHHAGCRKPFKRLWTSSLEDAAILEGMRNLQDGNAFNNLYASADCRDKADWLVGMNLSRLFSLVYRGKLAVGRVKTPTLAMIVERDSAITLFQPETTYSAALDLGGVAVSSEKAADIADAQQLAALCDGKAATVKTVDAQQKTVKPPKPYDLTTLQRECNRLYKYTAKQTLDFAQSLYESKLITCPRIDSQYLTEDMRETALAVIASILRLNLFGEGAALKHDPDIAPLLDNSKVSDHYAIIPTVNMETADMHALPREQQQVLTLIAGRLLCAVSPPHVYESTKLVVECGGAEFSATGKTVVEVGFKALERMVHKSEKKEKESTLPVLSVGQSLPVVAASVAEHVNSPPKPFTEDTLLSAMERAGNADYSDDAEKKGIGTPATRAAIIEGLVSDGYITRAKNVLAATKTGVNLVSVVPDEIRSPKLTADWEGKLQAIEKGELSADAFLLEIREMIQGLLHRYGGMKDSVDTSLFEKEKEVLGVCPRCGGSVLYGEKLRNFYCGDKACGFALWENNKLFASLGKSITKGMAKDFLSKGQCVVKGFVSQKTGKPFDATVILKDTGKYVNFDLKF